MRVTDFCTKEVATIPPEAGVAEAADKMATLSVGSLVVVDERDKVVGIVTDRDLALRVVAGPAGALETEPVRAFLLERVIGNTLQRCFIALAEAARWSVRGRPVPDPVVRFQWRHIAHGLPEQVGIARIIFVRFVVHQPGCCKISCLLFMIQV